ncbi:tRNA-splicing endonuclease subunit Sen54-like isoform X1 [Centruroides sculpturatus]|uniref:tRNA-splicing endonuclease subunit Sen54-like isoform X1 n=2 Tax=Centruroides sculpturatus TaxID=218467 RepID=UPI000C6DF051|nr:tRNA-splicing endonuclease subunit Sen54-like isoform X1 [Centruroides sculpturatus]XP_023220220.1 tRNA-splicing endonuclease subunit Sen54-like isoform X1 [Centruroides sculpturatus]
MADENKVLYSNNIKKDYPLLSAQELVKSRKSNLKGTQSYGQKGYIPTQSSKEKKRIESVIDEKVESLMEQRVIRSGDLQCAHWDPTRKKAFILKAKGKFMHHVGERIDNKIALYPEEILYLMETCYLELLYNEMPQSIQEAYSLVLEEPEALEKFQVYSYLSRLGYIVVRHRKRLQTSKRTNENVNFQHKMPNTDEEMDGQSKNSSEVNTNEKTLEVDSFEVISEVIESKDNNSCNVKSCLWEGIDIPNIAGKTELILESPLSHLLPENVSPQKKSYVINISAIKNECWHSKNTMKRSKSNKSSHPKRFNNSEKYDSRSYRESSYTSNYICDYKNYRNKNTKNEKEYSISYESQSNFYDDKRKLNKSNYGQEYKPKRKRSRKRYFGKSVGFIGFAGKISKPTNCWKDYKNEVKRSLYSIEKFSSDSTLEKADVIPLVVSSDILSTDEIFAKLNIFKNNNFKNIDTTNESLGYESDLIQVDFDVYLPNTKYKRKDPLPPAHRIKVKRLTDSVPKLSDFIALQSVVNDNVPLHYAIVDNGIISFYSFGKTSLPSLCNSTV